MGSLLAQFKKTWLYFRSGPLPRYYIFGLGPLFFIFTLLSFLNVREINLTFFLIGFLWPYALFTPGLEEKIKEKSYRFSFLRAFITLQRKTESYLPKIKNGWSFYLIYLLFPFIFSLMIFILAPISNVLYVILGWSLWVCLYKWSNPLNQNTF